MTSTEYLRLIEALSATMASTRDARTYELCATSIRTLAEQGRAALRNEFEGAARLFAAHGAAGHPELPIELPRAHRPAPAPAPAIPLATRRNGVSSRRANTRRTRRTLNWLYRAADAIKSSLTPR